MFDRVEMITELKAGVCTVTFTKVNGDERVMRCTLSDGYIPEEKRPQSEANNWNEDVTAIRCFDVEKNDWRAFKPENVVEFK